MAKVLCVLYDDPIEGYPTSYPRDDIPTIAAYPGGQSVADAERRRLQAWRVVGQRLG